MSYELQNCQEQRREKENNYNALQKESQELDTKMNKLREQKVSASG